MFRPSYFPAKLFTNLRSQDSSSIVDPKMLTLRNFLVSVVFVGLLTGLRHLSHVFQSELYLQTIGVEYETTLWSRGAFTCGDVFELMRNIR